MKKTLLFLICLAAVCTEAGVGESSVITLIFPFGARSCGMGETGTALADDESALFFNPAGLAIQDRRWQGGTVSQFYEQLLPALGLKDLYHMSYAANYQPLNSDIGGFGAFWNLINMGENTITDYIGNTRWFHSWEAVWALGWGFNFKEFGDTSHNYGVTFKYFFSALAPGYGPNGEGTASGFCFDLGYLYVSRFGLRVGFTLMNIGPNVFYIDKETSDPIPFTANLAMGYKKQVLVKNIRVADLACELRLDKELVDNSPEGRPEPFWKAMHSDWRNEKSFQEINIHMGWEVGLMNTGFLRGGLLLDFSAERYEYTQGFGVNIMDHLRCDFSYIYAPESFLMSFVQIFKSGSLGATGVRHRQWRLSFTLTGLAKWSENNRQWWKTSE
ncbi:MAG TPA: PorV/PorQ family protein [Chitinispirillaceae bacterium]|nr:PorV/PorQ family protein [Chitinispirillaceae bacterium]